LCAKGIGIIIFFVYEQAFGFILMFRQKTMVFIDHVIIDFDSMIHGDFTDMRCDSLDIAKAEFSILHFY